MMKKQVKIADLGVVSISDMEIGLDSSFELYISITDLSDGLKERVIKAVEEGKRQYEVDEKDYMERWKQSWCEAGVTIEPPLHIIFPEDGKFQYNLDIRFTDLEDEDITSSVFLEIDLSTHIEDIKKLVMHAMIDRFF